jgi:hypothetical protein
MRAISKSRERNMFGISSETKKPPCGKAWRLVVKIKALISLGSFTDC